MSDDREISKLISQSIRENLSADEQQKMAANIEQNEEARKFAEISKKIHQSVAGYQPDEVPEGMPALSSDLRERLKSSVASAVQEKLSMSQAGLIDQGGGSSSFPAEIDPTASPDAIIDSLHRFRPIRKLATGGIGEVWVAKDEKLGRNVVIKRLNAIAKDSSQAWDRFQREAEITGLLEHPNIVPLYMFGVDSRTEEPFYAMRFVGQRNLADAIEEHHDRVKAGQSEGFISSSFAQHFSRRLPSDCLRSFAWRHPS